MKRWLIIPVLAGLFVTAGCGDSGAGGKPPVAGDTIDTSNNAPAPGVAQGGGNPSGDQPVITNAPAATGSGH